MTVTPLERDQDCNLKIRDPDVPAPWILDPGGWSKTAVVSLYFFFPGICTLSLSILVETTVLLTFAQQKLVCSDAWGANDMEEATGKSFLSLYTTTAAATETDNNTPLPSPLPIFSEGKKKEDASG
ncbi:hypothetical protein STEG23_016615, partial [Scotinomys teguina]